MRFNFIMSFQFEVQISWLNCYINKIIQLGEARQTQWLSCWIGLLRAAKLEWRSPRERAMWLWRNVLSNIGSLVRLFSSIHQSHDNPCGITHQKIHRNWHAETPHCHGLSKHWSHNLEENRTRHTGCLNHKHKARHPGWCNSQLCCWDTFILSNTENHQDAAFRHMMTQTHHRSLLHTTGYTTWFTSAH